MATNAAVFLTSAPTVDEDSSNKTRSSEALTLEVEDWVENDSTNASAAPFKGCASATDSREPRPQQVSREPRPQQDNAPRPKKRKLQRYQTVSNDEMRLLSTTFTPKNTETSTNWQFSKLCYPQKPREWGKMPHKPSGGCSPRSAEQVAVTLYIG